MSWPMPNPGQWNPGIPMTPDMNMGSYPGDQWAAMQQNWQQWAQWQQQYAQWQNQYGEKYAEQMQAMQPSMQPAMGMGVMPPLPPQTAPPPAPPPPSQPPPPQENDQPLYAPVPPPGPPPPGPARASSAAPWPPMPERPATAATSATPATAPSTANSEALSKLAEEERLFDIQFQKWEEEIEKWKSENVNHPDKQAYSEYETKFEACRAQLLERRQLMNQKRARLLAAGNSPAPSSNGTAGSTAPAPPKPAPPANKNNFVNNAPVQNYKNNMSQNYTNQKNSSYQQYNESRYNKKMGNNNRQNRYDYNNIDDYSASQNMEDYSANQDEEDYSANQNMDDYTADQDMEGYTANQDTEDYTANQDTEDYTANPDIEDYTGNQDMEDYSPGDNYPDDANKSSFLPTNNTSKGIPGLDLVPEAEKPNQVQHEDVIDLSDEPPPQVMPSRGPDFSSISKGINSILGDEKIMNILSMVQGQVGPGANNKQNMNMQNINTQNMNTRNMSNQSNINTPNMPFGGSYGHNMPPSNQWDRNNSDYNQQYGDRPMPPNRQDQNYQQRNQSQNFSQNRQYYDQNQDGDFQDQYYEEGGQYGRPQREGPPMGRNVPPPQPHDGHMNQPPPHMRDMHGSNRGPSHQQGPPMRDTRVGGMNQPPPLMRDMQVGNMNQPPPLMRDMQGGNMNQGPPMRDMQGGNMNQGPPMRDMQGVNKNQGPPTRDMQGGNMNQGPPIRDMHGGNMNQGPPLRDMQRGSMNQGPPMRDMQGGNMNQGPLMRDMQGGNMNQSSPMNDMQEGGTNQPPPLMKLVTQPPPPRNRPVWVEEPLFTPSIIVEYEHVPLRLKAREFIEPVHTFDYNHMSKDSDNNKRADFEKEADELFSRKPRRSDIEDVYGSDRFSREREPNRFAREYEYSGSDRFPRDNPRQFERRPLRENRDDHRDDYRPRVPPRDEFDDRRWPEDRFDDRRRDDRDNRIGRREDMYKDRERERERLDRDRLDKDRLDRDRLDRDRLDRDRLDRDRLDRERPDRERDRDSYRDRNRETKRDDIRNRSHERDTRKRGRSKEKSVSSDISTSKKPKEPEPAEENKPKHIVMIDDILEPPGRDMRPEKIVIILRGPPGSGKSYLAKLIRDKEAEYGGTARIMSLDDYFMQEGEIEERDPTTGKTVKKPSLKYEYDANSEETYINSLKRAFKRSLTDGYFSFLIMDAPNEHLRAYADIWNYARQNGFQAYVCTLELDAQVCFKRNIHNRTLDDIQVAIARFFPTPSHHIQLDPSTLLQGTAITEVHMEDAVDDVIMEDAEDNEVESVFTSKWERMDDATQLARLDGTNKPLRPSQVSMADYLQLDDWKPNTAKPGKKTVRWADIEERTQQEKMRAIGFVVGQTDWTRMTDPTLGSSALTQTKYIERVRRNY